MKTLSMACDIGKIMKRSDNSTGLVRRWLALAAGILGIWLFVYGFAPWLQRHSEPVRTLSEYIDASGVNAGSFYYTSVEEVGEADRAIRNTFRFFPGGHDSEK